jgi:transposase-like protein
MSLINKLLEKKDNEVYREIMDYNFHLQTDLDEKNNEIILLMTEDDPSVGINGTIIADFKDLDELINKWKENSIKIGTYADKAENDDDWESFDDEVRDLFENNNKNDIKSFHKVEYPEDCIKVRNILNEMGYDVSLKEAEEIWQWFSSDREAGWLHVESYDNEQGRESLREVVEKYAEEHKIESTENEKIFDKEEIYQAWSKGGTLKYNNKKYRVGKMSYGDYFFEPAWKPERAETEGHDPETLWPEKIFVTNKYGVEQEKYKIESAKNNKFEIGDEVKISDDEYYANKIGEIIDIDIERDEFNPGGNEWMNIYKIEGDGIDSNSAESWVSEYHLEKVNDIKSMDKYRYVVEMYYKEGMVSMARGRVKTIEEAKKIKEDMKNDLKNKGFNLNEYYIAIWDSEAKEPMTEIDTDNNNNIQSADTDKLGTWKSNEELNAPEYQLDDIDYNMRETLNLFGIPNGDKVITSMFVKMGDGDFDEVWITDDSAPYNLGTEYILIYTGGDPLETQKLIYDIYGEDAFKTKEKEIESAEKYTHLNLEKSNHINPNTKKKEKYYITDDKKYITTMADKDGYSYWMRREDKVDMGDHSTDYVFVTDDSDKAKNSALETLNKILLKKDIKSAEDVAILINKSNPNDIIEISDIETLDELYRQGLITEKWDDENKVHNEYWFDIKDDKNIDKIIYDIQNKGLNIESSEKFKIGRNELDGIKFILENKPNGINKEGISEIQMIIDGKNWATIKDTYTLEKQIKKAINDYKKISVKSSEGEQMEMKNVSDTMSLIKNIEIDYYISLDGNWHEVKKEDVNEMINDHYVYLDDKSFIEKWNDKGYSLHPHGDYEVNDNLSDNEDDKDYKYDEMWFGVTYYIYTKDEGLITFDFMDWREDYNGSLEVRKQSENTDKIFDILNSQNTWDIDIDTLMKKVNEHNEEKIKSSLKNKITSMLGEKKYTIGEYTITWIADKKGSGPHYNVYDRNKQHFEGYIWPKNGKELNKEEIKKQLKELNYINSSKNIKSSVIQDMVNGYLETMLWSSYDESTPSGGEPMDKNYNINDISEETKEEANKDCAEFSKQAGDLLKDKITSEDWWDIGHNFWLTRNGHGAGFWDSDNYEKEIGQKLTEISKKFGEKSPYIGDDGKIYASINDKEELINKRKEIYEKRSDLANNIISYLVNDAEYAESPEEIKNFLMKYMGIKKEASEKFLKEYEQKREQILHKNAENIKQGKPSYTSMLEEEDMISELINKYMDEQYTVKSSEIKKDKPTILDISENETEENEPQEDDMYLTPSGPLGSKTSVSVEGKFLGEYNSEEEAVKAIKEWIDKNNFYPNIWYVSDHGNISPYSIVSINANLEKIEVGDLVKVDINKVKQYDNVEPYIKLVNNIIRDADGEPYVYTIEDGKAELSSHKYSAMSGTVWVPIEALKFIKKNDFEIESAKSQFAKTKDGWVVRIINKNEDCVECNKWTVKFVDGPEINKTKDIEINELTMIEGSTKINSGDKKYKEQHNVGKAKYTISYHDGKKKHEDGSDFYDIKIFKNKKELENFKSELKDKGYIESSDRKSVV